MVSTQQRFSACDEMQHDSGPITSCVSERHDAMYSLIYWSRKEYCNFGATLDTKAEDEERVPTRIIAGPTPKATGKIALLSSEDDIVSPRPSCCNV